MIPIDGVCVGNVGSDDRGASTLILLHARTMDRLDSDPDDITCKSLPYLSYMNMGFSNAQQKGSTRCSWLRVDLLVHGEAPTVSRLCVVGAMVGS